MEEPPPILTPEDLFASTQKAAYYMPRAETQQPPRAEGGGVHVAKCGKLLAFNISISNWITNTGTFGAVRPNDFCRDNVSMFLKFIQWAMQAKINVYIETLYDDTLAQTTPPLLEEVGKRLWAPIPEHKVHEYAAAVMASLLPEEEQQPQPRAKKRRVSKPAAAGRVDSGGMAHDPDVVFDEFVSQKRINSERKLADTLHRALLCSAESEVRELNYDMLGDAAASAGDAGDDAGAADEPLAEDDPNSVFYLLDHRRLFEHKTHLLWYEESRVPEFQRIAGTYYDEGEKTFTVYDDEAYERFPFGMQIIRPGDGFLAGNADNLRTFLQQSVQCPWSEYRKMHARLAANAGLRRRDLVTAQTDAETAAMFVPKDGRRPLFRDFAHSAKIQAPDPFSASQGMTYSKQYEYLKTPIAAKMMDDFRRRRNQLHARIEAGQLDARELARVDDDMAEAVYSVLETKDSPGVPKMWSKVWEERKALRAKMFPEHAEDDTPVAAMARKMHDFEGALQDTPEVRGMAFEDKLFCSYCDVLANDLVCTPFQIMVIMKCKTYCQPLLRNTFGDQSGVCMQGTCDVGKSYTAERFTCMFPICMIQSENDASDKAWVMTDMSMTIVWKDEMNYGGVNDGPKSRDDRTTRSAFSTGILHYNMFNMGRKGDSNTLKRYVVDMRSFCVATINNELNPALTSRFDVVPTFQEPKRQRGKKKIEKACTDSNSVAIQAANMMFQWGHTALCKFWACHGVGAFDINMRNFEVFCSIYSKIMVSRGSAMMMARDVDKLRKLSLGVMVDRVTSALEHDRGLAAARDNPACFMRYYQIHGSVVRMKDILVASSMAKPVNDSTKMDRVILRVIKKNVMMRKGADVEAVTNEDGTYYATVLVKKDVVKDLTESAHSMGEDCSVGMMARAYRLLKESSVQSSKCVEFDTIPNGADNKEYMFIKKELVGSIGVLTDSEVKVLEWVRRVVAGPATGGFPTWGVEYESETDILLHKHLRAGLIEAPPITNTVCDGLIRELRRELDDRQRYTAMFWLQNTVLEDGTMFFTDGSGAETPNARVRGNAFLEDATVVSETCRADGPYPGRHKENLNMAGSMRVSRHALDTFDQCHNKVRETNAHWLADAIMSISGEASPGDTIFYGTSDTIDDRTSAAMCYTIKPWRDASLVVPNPRRREKSSVLDHLLIQDDDDILSESAPTLTLTPDSATTRRIQRRACWEQLKMEPGEAEAEFDARYRDAAAPGARARGTPASPGDFSDFDEAAAAIDGMG